MNPLSHAQIAQDTHREYEAKYGRRYGRDESSRAKNHQPGVARLVLALGGASVIVVVATILSLL